LVDLAADDGGSTGTVDRNSECITQHSLIFP
jgi:hypothetical protein